MSDKSKAKSTRYVSRGGEKLAWALDAFGLSAVGLVCADLGSHVGGFVDCLLQRGARTVYSVDTSYGTLAWKLRIDPRVRVLERTNAMHVSLPEPVDLVTIDAGWTRQEKVLPNAAKLLKENGAIVTLIKPHYEADTELLHKGTLPGEHLEVVLNEVLAQITDLGLSVRGRVDSPIPGHGGNREFLAHLTLSQAGKDVSRP